MWLRLIVLSHANCPITSITAHHLLTGAGYCVTLRGTGAAVPIVRVACGAAVEVS